jgi:PKHD-type hydroxylase
MAAKRVKNNEEVASDQQQLNELNAVVMGNLVRHPVYINAALPYRVATPFYARYTRGMAYGDHVDDPVMGVEDRYRSDISITVFLNEPQSYEGGDLVIRTAFGDQTIKYPGGDAVMYPSSSRHHVNEVTRGERLVAVTWVQSLVRDNTRREILYELSRAREKMLVRAPDAAETKHVDTAYVNLVRLWAEL